MAMVIAAFSLSRDRLTGAPPFAEPWTGYHDEAARISDISWQCRAGAPGCGGGRDVRPDLSFGNTASGVTGDDGNSLWKSDHEGAGRARIRPRSGPDL